MSDGREYANETIFIILAQQGDREAFDKLVDLYDRKLLYFIHRIIGEHHGALDILQNVWVNVFRKIKKLKSPASFRVWLYRIAHDLAVTELRKKMRRPISIEQIDTVYEKEEESNPDQIFENAELVHLALCELSTDHRRVLTLYFLEDMSISQIAEVISCKTGTVKSRIHYAKNKLRQQIEEMLDE